MRYEVKVITFVVMVVLLRLGSSEDPYCSITEMAVGSIKDRIITDTTNRLYIIDATELNCYGRIKGWVFYSTLNQAFKPGVWRKTTGNYFKLVGENTMSATSSGYTSVEVPASDRIAFQPGDMLGFRHSSPALHYDLSLESTTLRYVGISDYHTEIAVGSVYTVSSTTERAYSIKAYFEDEDYSVDCAAETHGPGPESRSSNDGGNYIMIMYSQPFTCYGQVKGWSFYHATNGGFKAGVYRITNDAKTTFLLTGENEIPGSVYDNNVANSHLVENEDEWLYFEPGDVIGWRWKGDGSRIRHDSGAADSMDMRYTGHSDADYAQYGVGDTFTVGSSLGRAYSLQALISPMGYKGCFYENFASREFTVPVGQFGLQEMTPELCVSRCAKKSYTYAAVQQGDLCFCSQSYGQTTIGNSTLCTDPCPGKPLYTCGGVLLNKVFSTPLVLVGFNLEKLSGE